MGTISFKIPKADKKFLEWYSSKTAEPLGSIYRSATLEEFHKWKINYLISQYAKGELGFKEMCNLGEISLSNGMFLLQENDIEPPIPEIIDQYTINVTLENIKLKNDEIYKKSSGLARKSPPIEFNKEK